MIMDLLRQFGMNFNQEKAHDAIDGVINDWEKSKGFSDELMGNMSLEHQGILSNILEGITTGGMGGTIKTGKEALKLFRGIPKWFRGSTEKGKWLGGKSDGKKGIFATPDKKYAEEYLGTEEAGGRLLEFEIPKKYIKNLYKSDIDESFGFIEGGLPKEFLKKVHKPRYSEYDKKWFYDKLINVIDELK